MNQQHWAEVGVRRETRTRNALKLQPAPATRPATQPPHGLQNAASSIILSRSQWSEQSRTCPRSQCRSSPCRPHSPSEVLSISFFFLSRSFFPPWFAPPPSNNPYPLHHSHSFFFSLPSHLTLATSPLSPLLQPFIKHSTLPTKSTRRTYCFCSGVCTLLCPQSLIGEQAGGQQKKITLYGG